jgi:hypothetical protein
MSWSIGWVVSTTLVFLIPSLFAILCTPLYRDPNPEGTRLFWCDLFIGVVSVSSIILCAAFAQLVLIDWMLGGVFPHLLHGSMAILILAIIFIQFHRRGGRYGGWLWLKNYLHYGERLENEHES